MTFTEKEENFLYRCGFEEDNDGNFVAENDWCKTVIIKDAKNSFSWQYTSFINESQSKTFVNLTRAELIESLGLEPIV